MLQNKKASFWIRFLSTLIDLIIFCVIGITLSLICLQKKEFSSIQAEIYQISDDSYLYYIWLILLIITIVIQYIAIPFCFKGKTIGMMITRLEIDFQNSLRWKVIIKRIELGPMLWIVVIIFFMCFVWTSTINKMTIISYIRTHFSHLQETDSNYQIVKELLEQNKLSLVERICYSIPASTSPLILFLNLFMLISIGFRKSKIGLVDRFSSSFVVYKNKFEKTPEKDIQVIEPEAEENYNIVWKE